MMPLWKLIERAVPQAVDNAVSGIGTMFVWYNDCMHFTVVANCSKKQRLILSCLHVSYFTFLVFLWLELLIVYVF